MPIRTLRVLTTHDCNLRCYYCCAEGYKSPFSILNYYNVFNIIEASHRALKIRRVKYTGGEPFLFGDLISVIKEVNRCYSDDINQSIVTNGTHVDRLKDLIKCRISDLDITISLPSINPDTFRSITGQSLLNEVLKSIEVVLSAGYSLKINCVLVKDTNSSAKYVRDFLDFFNKGDNISIRFLQTIFNSCNGLSPECSITSDQFAKEIQQIGFSILPQSNTRSSILFRDNERTIKFIKFFCSDHCTVCPQDKTSIWVTPNGIIRKCCYGNLSSQDTKINAFDPDTIHATFNKIRTWG